MPSNVKKTLSIFWFRRDLRVDDNVGFYHALASGQPVLPVFIFDTQILGKLPVKRDRRVAFIHSRLEKLQSEFEKHGSSLYVAHGPPDRVFRDLLKEFDIRHVFTNHDYEPAAIARDNSIRDLLQAHSIDFRTFKDQVIFDRSDILKQDGTPYTVFTPYSKQWKKKFDPSLLRSFDSQKNLGQLVQIRPYRLPALRDIGFEAVDPDYPDMDLSEKTIRNYSKTRDIPAIDGTSQISAYLRFGTISIRHLVKLAVEWSDTWLGELIWREFFMSVLYHFPRVVDHNFKAQYDGIRWRNNEREFELWCRGETGYPIVDAGMRQLNESGWMHNRVRMIVAGFLTKHLLIDWRWGEAYFAEKLLDYELSSNNGNWQWAAGTGCDAAPYFRIFNPVTQLKKFDPDQVYLKTWIKDFNNYDLIPVVDHEFARKRALDAYKTALDRG